MHVVRIDPSFITLCPEGACDVVMFWDNRTTDGRCPCCGGIGEDVGRIETAPEGRPVEIEVREHPVGRSGQREVDGGSRVLHDNVGRLERARDHDSQEEG